MTTLEAQQDIYFVALAALVNVSVLRSAQPLLARKGLKVLLGTGTFLYARVSSATCALCPRHLLAATTLPRQHAQPCPCCRPYVRSKRTLDSEAETKLLHLLSYIMQNLAQHPANRTLMYKAELLGTTSLDKLIEHVSSLLQLRASHLPPL